MNHTDEVGFHQGHALIAAMRRYFTLSAALRECVQNCIDNAATYIVVNVDYKKSRASVHGNGNSPTTAEFATALKSVFSSTKATNSKKYGRFGIGLFAPGDKCLKYLFIALDPQSNKTHSWVFEEKVIDAAETVRIPRIETTPLEDGFTTASIMEGLISDKSRMNCSAAELASDIRTEFSVAIREQKIRVEITFVSDKGVESNDTVSEFFYSGEPLPPVAYGKSEKSRADFYLYLAPLEAGRRVGQINVGIDENPFRLTLRQILNNAPDGAVSTDLRKALLDSGVFSGEIISTGCLLNENRKSWRRNDALADFCGYLLEWWLNVGTNLYEDIKAENEETRFQNLGEQALKKLALMMSAPELESYRKLMNSFDIGTIGEEHVPVDPSLVVGTQDVPSVEAKADREGKGKGGKGDSEKEKLDHNPLTVTGKRGQRRTQVRDNSLGLQITFSEMQGSGRMYSFDSKTGILQINIRHPHWESLEESDQALIQYQTMCIFQALVGLNSNPDDPDQYYKLSVVPLMELWVTHARLSS